MCSVKDWSTKELKCYIIFEHGKQLGISDKTEKSLAKPKERKINLESKKSGLDRRDIVSITRNGKRMDIPTKFCGLSQDSRITPSNSSRSLAEMYIAVIFADFTLFVLLKDGDRSFEEWLKQCKILFEHDMTKCVTRIASPKTFASLQHKSQVLIAISCHGMSLLDKSYPHFRLVGWPWSRDKMKCSIAKSGQNDLHIFIEGEGMLEFTSHVTYGSKILTDIMKSINVRLDAGRSEFKEPPSRARHTEGATDYQPYSLNLNSFVEENQSLYSNIVLTVNNAMPPRGTYLKTGIRIREIDSKENTSVNGYCIPFVKRGTSQAAVHGYLELMHPRNEAEDDYLMPHPAACRGSAGDGYLTTDPAACRSSVPGNSSNRFDPTEESSNETDICRTIELVLKRIAPTPDTLQLSHSQRIQLAVRLYEPSAGNNMMESWQLLGEYIGLTFDAINLIVVIIKNHSIENTAAEIVLRHWQYVYNKYGQTDAGGDCPRSCNKQTLMAILGEIGRPDLVEMLKDGSASRST